MLTVIYKMLVVGPLFQIAAFLAQFLLPPFPAFVLSFALGGIGLVFQVCIIYLLKKGLQAIMALITVTHARMHLRMASSRLFKRILNTKWGLSTLHMVIPFPNMSHYQTNNS